MKYYLILVSITAIAHSSFIIVPSDYDTISLAIEASASGDTILVSPGVYQEEIDFSGKSIAVIGTSGPEVTCIQSYPSGGGPVVSIVSGEGPGTVLEGFMITGGSSVRGGGIKIVDASPLILDNIIYGNQAFNSYNAYGGGIYIEDSSPVIVGNYIYGNMAMSFDPTYRFAYGGGIYAENSQLEILNNRIEQNYIDLGSACWGYGSGVYTSGCTGHFSNNVIAGNYSESSLADGVGIHSPGCELVNNTVYGNEGLGIQYAASVVNCIVWTNNGSSSQIVTDGPVTYSNVMYGYSGEGNISSLPQFEAGPLSDFHLDSSVSPCIDAGNPSPEYYDPEGDPGLAHWPSYGTLLNDMGAYGGPGAAYWFQGYTDIDEFQSATAGNLTLHGTVTNPVRNTAVIAFTASQSASVEISVYDAAGRAVFRESSLFGQGYHTVSAGMLPPGLYLCRVHSSGESLAGRFIVIR